MSLRGAFLRRGNLEVIDFFKTEIASLRSQRRLKDFFSDLLENYEERKPAMMKR
jgi:hypothetical protein